MTGRDTSPHVSDYPSKLDNGSELLGVDREGSVIYWDPVREVKLDGDISPDGDLSQLTERGDLNPGDTVEDVVQEIEETVGWSSLTERASDLLDGDDSSN